MPLTERRPSGLMLRILTLVARSERGVPLREIVTATQAARPSASRSLRRLVRRGLVELHRPLLVRRTPRRWYTERVTATQAGRLAVNSLPRGGKELTEKDRAS